MEIEHWHTARDGPVTEDGLRKKIERRGYRVSRYVYPPGTRFPDHRHTVDKIDGVVCGRFRMVVEGCERILEAGDLLAVPAGTVHSAEVVGAEDVVSLDGVAA